MSHIEIKADAIELVPLKDLKPNPKNRNKHDKDQIERMMKLIEYQGFRDPIIVSKRSGYVAAGHGRIMAAKKLKLKEVPVIYQDFESDDQEMAFGVSHNAIAEWSELDFTGINEDISTLDGVNFDIDWLGIKNFTIDVADKEELSDPDEIPEKVEPKAKLGDIYQLGQHRLMCGDSTRVDTFDKLMGSKRACITFTSPPYNVGKTPNGNDQKYLNDSDNKDSSEYVDFLRDFSTLCLQFSSYVFVNIQSLSGNKIALIDYLHAMRDFYADTIIWDKETSEPAMAKNCLNSQFEYVHVLSHKANRIIGTIEFRGTLSNVFKFQSRKDKEFSKIHKATFPVAFAEYFISNFAVDSVIDPFCGSGTSIIACEKLGKACYGIELDPHYVDIIISRWEKYTGQKAELLNA